MDRVADDQQFIMRLLVALLLSDQKTQITLSVLSMVFPDTEPVFLAFLPGGRSTEAPAAKEEKTEESTFFLLPPVHFLFPFPTQIPSRI